MEEVDRLVRLETHAEHSKGELGEVRSDLKELRKDIRELREGLAALALNTERNLAATNASIAALALTMERSMARLRIWELMMGAGLLAVIARAFHWL